MLCISQYLERVQQALNQKAPALINHKGARPHLARVAKNNVRRLGWEILCHPPYSPDPALTDYHLFHSLGNHLRGKFFVNEADLRQALTDFFVPKTSDFYRQAIAELEAH